MQVIKKTNQYNDYWLEGNEIFNTVDNYYKLFFIYDDISIIHWKCGWQPCLLAKSAIVTTDYIGEIVDKETLLMLN